MQEVCFDQIGVKGGIDGVATFTVGTNKSSKKERTERKRKSANHDDKRKEIAMSIRAKECEVMQKGNRKGVQAVWAGASQATEERDRANLTLSVSVIKIGHCSYQ